MNISHTLKNTGQKTIETNVYDHNFLVIDKEPAGPGYVIKFQVDVTGTGKGIGDIAQIQGKQMTLLSTPKIELKNPASFYCR
jgi:hypothetical protein